MERFPEPQAPRGGAPDTLRPALAIVIGDGQFGMNAVGTAPHQDELERIAGGRTQAGADVLCGALLVPEPKNPRDPGAVAVVISSQVIGYLPSDVAPSLKEALRAGQFVGAGCAARIVGGAERPSGEGADFGVRLDAYVPFRLQSIAKQPARNAAPLLVVRDDSPPPMAARPIEPHAFGERVVEPEELAPGPGRGRRAVSALVDLILIVAILVGGFWWVQRLPREPLDAATPAAVSPPADVQASPPPPAPLPEPAAPPPVLAPWPVAPAPPDPSPAPAAAEPAAPPQASAPSPAPVPRRKPAPAEKPKAKPSAPNPAPSTAPLKLN